jgi:uncharacterized protein (DUF2141 family)
MHALQTRTTFARSPRTARKANSCRPMIHALERRTLLSTVVVNTILDTAHPGFTSLRDAVLVANGTPNTTITFSPTVFATHKTIITTGILVLTGTGIKVTGPTVGVTISANNIGVGDFYCGLPTASWTLSNLTLTGGRGAINNNGIGTLNNVTVTGNVGVTGDGIYNNGTLTVTNSTISGNSGAGSVAGGIYNANKAHLTLTNVTISRNSSGEGAGLDNAGTATLTNVTVSGNTCTALGGGIYNNQNGTMTLDNVTVSGNTATNGGGLLVFLGTSVTMANTVIAGNTVKTGTNGQDVAGAVTSQGFNFIGKKDGSTGWVASDKTGTAAAPLAAKLGALANNGGPTFTLLPLAGSPLIDKGSNALVRAGSTTDQRGLARIQNVTVDIGAVEVVPPPVSIAGLVFSDVNGNGKLDTGEKGIPNVKVYLDTNKNGTPDSGEAFILTDASGNYKFSNLNPGAYRVREVVPSGNVLVAPVAGLYDLTLAPGVTSVGSNFADKAAGATASISGRVYNDANGNGLRDVGEAGLGLFKVFIDANKNGVLDTTEVSVTTDINGNWSFANLAAGTYSIRVVPVTGLTVTKPTGGVLSITVTAGQASAGNLFGERSAT